MHNKYTVVVVKGNLFKRFEASFKASAVWKFKINARSTDFPFSIFNRLNLTKPFKIQKLTFGEVSTNFLKVFVADPLLVFFHSCDTPIDVKFCNDKEYVPLCSYF
jgi:hypothetical protein